MKGLHDLCCLCKDCCLTADRDLSTCNILCQECAMLLTLFALSAHRSQQQHTEASNSTQKPATARIGCYEQQHSCSISSSCAMFWDMLEAVLRDYIRTALMSPCDLCSNHAPLSAEVAHCRVLGTKQHAKLRHTYTIFCSFILSGDEFLTSH